MGKPASEASPVRELIQKQQPVCWIFNNSNSHRADGAGWTEQLWRDQHIPVNGRLDVLAVPHDEAEFICSVVAFGAAGAVAAVVAAGLGDADVAREKGRVAALIDHARADESRGRGG